MVTSLASQPSTSSDLRRSLEQSIDQYMRLVSDPRFRPVLPGLSACGPEDIQTHIIRAAAKSVFKGIYSELWGGAGTLKNYRFCYVTYLLMLDGRSEVTPEFVSSLTEEECALLHKWIFDRKDLLATLLSEHLWLKRDTRNIGVALGDLADPSCARVFCRAFLLNQTVKWHLEPLLNRYHETIVNIVAHWLTCPDPSLSGHRMLFADLARLFYLTENEIPHGPLHQAVEKAITDQISVWEASEQGLDLSELVDLHVGQMYWGGKTFPDVDTSLAHVLKKGGIAQRGATTLENRLRNLLTLQYSRCVLNHPKLRPDEQLEAQCVVEIMKVTSKQWEEQDLHDAIDNTINLIALSPDKDREALFSWSTRHLGQHGPNCVFRKDDHIITIKKLALIRSPYFARMLVSHYREATTSSIDVPEDLPLHVLQAILNHIESQVFPEDWSTWSGDDIMAFIYYGQLYELRNFVPELDAILPKILETIDRERWSVLQLFRQNPDGKKLFPKTHDAAYKLARKVAELLRLISLERIEYVTSTRVDASAKEQPDIMAFLLEHTPRVIISPMPNCAKYDRMNAWGEEEWGMVEQWVAAGKTCKVEMTDKRWNLILEGDTRNALRPSGVAFIRALREAWPRMMEESHNIGSLPRFDISYTLKPDQPIQLTIALQTGSALKIVAPLVAKLNQRHETPDLSVEHLSEASPDDESHAMRYTTVDVCLELLTPDFISFEERLPEYAILALSSTIRSLWDHWPSDWSRFALNVSSRQKASIAFTRFLSMIIPPEDMPIRHLSFASGNIRIDYDYWLNRNSWTSLASRANPNILSLQLPLDRYSDHWASPIKQEITGLFPSLRECDSASFDRSSPPTDFQFSTSALWMQGGKEHLVRLYEKADSLSQLRTLVAPHWYSKVSIEEATNCFTRLKNLQFLWHTDLKNQHRCCRLIRWTRDASGTVVKDGRYSDATLMIWMNYGWAARVRDLDRQVALEAAATDVTGTF